MEIVIWVEWEVFFGRLIEGFSREILIDTTIFHFLWMGKVIVWFYGARNLSKIEACFRIIRKNYWFLSDRAL